MGSGEITKLGIMGRELSVECHRVERWGSSNKFTSPRKIIVKVVTGHCSEPGEELRRRKI